jgi:hypothetical protein
MLSKSPFSQLVEVDLIFINNTNDAITRVPIKVETIKRVRASVRDSGDFKYWNLSDNSRRIEKVIKIQKHELMNDNRLKPDKVIIDNVNYKIERIKLKDSKEFMIDLSEMRE